MYLEDNDALFIMRLCRGVSATAIASGTFALFSVFVALLYLFCFSFFFAFLSFPAHCVKTFRLLDVATFSRDNRNSIRSAHLSFIYGCLHSSTFSAVLALLSPADCLPCGLLFLFAHTGNYNYNGNSISISTGAAALASSKFKLLLPFSALRLK